MKYLGKYLESIIKTFLHEGGDLILGGIIYIFFDKFY